MWLGLQHRGLSMGQISCMVFRAPSMIVQQAMQDTAWSFLTKFSEATQHHFHSFILVTSVTSPHKFKRRIQKPYLLMETVSCGIEVNVVDTVEKHSLTQKVLFWQMSCETKPQIKNTVNQHVFNQHAFTKHHVFNKPCARSYQVWNKNNSESVLKEYIIQIT